MRPSLIASLHLVLPPLVCLVTTAAGEAQCYAWQSRYGPGFERNNGVNGSGRCSAEFLGDLYVGGTFDRVDSLPAGSLARWNGSSWLPVDLGVSGVKYPTIYDLAVHDDGTGPALYAGGDFLAAGSVNAHHIARWDGVRWSEVGVSNEFLDGRILALAVHDDGTGLALYAGGSFTRSGTTTLDHVARWNGLSWEPLDGGMDAEVSELFVFGGQLYAGGGFSAAGTASNTSGVARWNGTKWEAVGQGLAAAGTPPYEVGALAFQAYDSGSGPQLYAGGWFLDSGGTEHDLARWDGSQWTLLRQSTSATYALESFDDGAGALLYSGRRIDAWTTHEVLTSYDGTTFATVPMTSPITTPNQGASVLGFATYAAGSGPELHAIGYFEDVLQTGVPVGASGMARWDGADWHALGSSPADLDGGGVEDYQLFDDGGGAALYAAGRFTHIGAQATNHVARWDGSQWSPLGAGTDNRVIALAVHDDGSGGALYAGGSFKNAGGNPALRVARWDGSQWSAVGAGLPTKARVMQSHDDGSGPALYAAGGQLPVSRWDGSSWSPVGSNPPFGWSMAVHDDGSGPALYIGDGNYLENSWGELWKWDGQSWISVGTTDSRVTAIQPFDDGNGMALYASGAFTIIGGAAIQYIARWDGNSWSTVGTQPFNDRVKCMAIYDDGSGPRLAAHAVNDTQLWDGSSWTALQKTYPPNHSGVDLQAWGQELYVAAEYTWGTVFWGPSFECPRKLICNNNSPCINSSIEISGTPSHSLPVQLDLRAATLGSTQGLFFFGRSGEQFKAWGSSNSALCVKPPVQRLPVSNTGGTPGICDGLLNLDFNQWMLANPGKAPQAGDAVWLQGWYLAPSSPQGSYLTGAVEFYVWP